MVRGWKRNTSIILYIIRAILERQKKPNLNMNILYFKKLFQALKWLINDEYVHKLL